MQILNILLYKRYLVLFLIAICAVSNIVAPFQTPTPDILAPSKQIISNTLPLVEGWRWSGKVDNLSIPLLPDDSMKDRIIIIGRKGADQRIIVLDAHTGNALWESENIGNIYSVTTDEERVYIGSITYVQAFDLETGQKLWRGAEQPSLKRGGFVVHVTKGQVEVYDTLKPVVYILDAATGQTIDQISKSLFLRRDGIDYAIVQGNYLLEARDAKTNEKLWSYGFPGYIDGWPVFVGNTMLLNARGQIFGLDVKTGEVIWQTPESQTTFTHPQYVTSVALQGNLAYVLRYDAAIVGFNPETGEQVGLIEMMPNRTMEDDKGDVKLYAIATSDKFVAVYYGNSEELIVFEKLSVESE